jgi:hypothetical protein
MLPVYIIKTHPMFSSLFRPGTHDLQFETIPRNGVFDAVASVIVNDSDLEDSTKFECELKIPETNYTVKKTVTLTRGKYLN